MIYFAQLDSFKDEDKIVSMFERHGALRSDIIINSIRERFLYDQVKESLLKHPEGLVIDSVDSLGEDIWEIQQELSWLLKHDIELEILDCPHFVKEHTGAVYEVITSVRKRVENSVRHIKYYKTANRKDAYDKQFQDLFWAYEEKRLRARDMARILEININTLYKRIRTYRELLETVCAGRGEDTEAVSRYIIMCKDPKKI